MDFNARNNDGNTALHLLCENYRCNMLEIVQSLIEKFAYVNARNQGGYSNLLEIVQFMIEKGFNARTRNGMTKLLLLCENYSNSNLLNLVQLLILKGADVSAKEKLYGNTALHCLC